MVHTITNQSVLTLFASLFAFVSGQLFLIEAYVNLKINKKIALVLAILLAQAVDSVMFFGIAFYDNPNVLEFMFTGLLIKSILTIIASPLLFISKYE